MTRFLIAALIAAAFSFQADAQPKANQLFGAKSTASPHQPQAFGSYAKGCAAGLQQLPETGPSWQAMRLSRNRNWGHPVALDYIADLGEVAQSQGWAGLYIGDISQPRGGPMTSGHSSHQMGLDIDIWMLPPRRLDLGRRERENISSISVRTADQTSVNSNWTPQHHNILKAAAKDPRVDRIFVAAAVKVEMCRTATRRDRAWLQRIRPLYGHNYHFHVRLKCPDDSPACITQTPTVRELSKGGDGCDDSLRWWVTTYLNNLKNPPPPDPNYKPRRHPRNFTMQDLPSQCQTVLSAG
ncbi:MAG: penicillin-insensitive murein endopeptidase [Pseudomonadota bacterium]